jgi:nitrate/nitrite transporter NarK
MEECDVCNERLQSMAVRCLLPHTLAPTLHTEHVPGTSSPAIKNFCQQRKANTILQPSIIKDLGYSAAEAQLLTIPPYALATILTVAYAVVSERYSRRGPFILFSTTIAIIGYIILLTNTSPTSKPGVSYVGVFFAAAGIYPSVALALSWPAVNVSGQTKRATANAMQITIGNVGAVIGTQLYRPTGAPRYVVGHGTALGYLVGNLVVVSVIWWVHARINKKRDREVAEGKRYEGEWLGDADQRWRFGL